MDNKLFRKNSLERVSSPEQLNDYVKVSSPGIWIILAAVIVLLIGACVWGIWGRLETTVPAVVISKNGTAVCCCDTSYIAKVEVGMTVRVSEGNLASRAFLHKRQNLTTMLRRRGSAPGSMDTSQS